MRLLVLLRTHGAVIEADVQRYYGVDTTDLWRGTLTPRRLWVLLRGLPPDCQTAYALAGEQYAPAYGWGLTQLLLGRLVDEMAVYRWQWEQAHTDPKKGRRRPVPAGVLPKLTQDEGNVIPLVSPHQLGGFVNTQEVTSDGD